MKECGPDELLSAKHRSKLMLRMKSLGCCWTKFKGRRRHRVFDHNYLAKSEQIALSRRMHTHNNNSITFCHFGSMVFINVQPHHLYHLVIRNWGFPSGQAREGCSMVEHPCHTITPPSQRITTTPPRLPYTARSQESLLQWH